MKIEKTHLVDIPAVYVTAILHLAGKEYFALASENRDEKVVIIDADTLEVSPLWTGDTGCMNIVQIPGTEKLLCITKFYPVFQSKEAEICMLEPTDKGYMSPWKKTTIMKLPFCHRIGVITTNSKMFLLASTLCDDKEFQDDWRKPGAIYTAPIDEKLTEWTLTKHVGGLLKNHGLCIDKENQVYTSSENGILHFDFSNYVEGASVKPTLLTGFPTSDISFNDGMIATIEPFHGNVAKLYDSNIKEVYSCDIDFGHVVWLGNILGKPSMILGSRGGRKQLELIDVHSMERTIIDEGIAPTQISVVSRDETSVILSANHGAGNAFLYTLR